MGQEGEALPKLIPEFERANPNIKVRVQAIPWTAAHEKLLTAFVGDASPDISQLGNTWVPELSMLGALEPLGPWVSKSALDTTDVFRGIWLTNVINDSLFGVPWYVDTRLMFYRKDLLARAGWGHPPTTWAEWGEAMKALKARAGPNEYPILLPLDEWAQPTIFGLQNGSTILKSNGTYAAFREPVFRDAFEFYMNMFRNGWAPKVAAGQVANIYQEFAKGGIAMYITGPWNIGEFTRRLPPELKDAWATVPIPGPAPGKSLSIAGGSSLVLFKSSKHKEASWKLLEFLTSPEQQRKLYELTGDLPARPSAWTDSTLAQNPRAQSFFEQLQRVVPLPQVPEWEQIATMIAQASEQVARERMTTDEALTALERDVNGLLRKRRWMLERVAATAKERP
jgi:multiple sugar transport system substrate-binding protein